MHNGIDTGSYLRLNRLLLLVGQPTKGKICEATQSTTGAIRLEAALTGTAAGGLDEHVLKCANCAEELAALRARREQLDALLPLVAQGAEAPAEFRARVLAAAEAASEAKRGRPWRVWGLAGAMALIVSTLMIGLMLHRRAVRAVPETELAVAQRLAEWRAPSDVLLETPGREILRTTPRLGESYLHVPVKTDEEE